MDYGVKLAGPGPGIFFSSALETLITRVWILGKKEGREMHEGSDYITIGRGMDRLTARVLKLQADNHRFKKMFPALIEKIFG